MFFVHTRFPTPIMRILTWNVNGTFPPSGSAEKIERQVDWIATLDERPTVLLLQEVNPNRRDLWREFLLEKLEYGQVVDSIDLAKKYDNSNGHLTAVRGEWRLSDEVFWSGSNLGEEATVEELGTEYPEKILVTEIERGQTELELWNVRAVPGGSYPEEKIALLELIYDRIENDGQKPRVLGGDLNTPKSELSDGQAVTFGYDRNEEFQRRAINAELNILKGLGHFGMVDVFRAKHGFGDVEPFDVTHGGRRIDHLFVSDGFSVSGCWISESGAERSDHAPVIADIDV